MSELTEEHGVETCSCGAVYPVIRIYERTKSRERKLSRDRSSVYPIGSCHCYCGVKWGEHGKELSYIGDNFSA